MSETDGFVATMEHLRVSDQQLTMVGSELGWKAPLAVVDAPHGFDKSAWIDELPLTMLAHRISGAAVLGCTRSRLGAHSATHRNTALQPRGSPNWSTCDGRVRFAQIYLPDTLLDRVAMELGHAPISGMLRDDLWFFDDSVFESQVRAYVNRSLATGEPPTSLEMEARSLLLLERLVTRHHVQRPSREAFRGGLSGWQLRRAIEYLEANYAEDIELGELAQVVGLSVFHFARAFKQTTGLAPCAYLRRLRAERAIELLGRNEVSISEIAPAVGYETPQAFARMFRAEVGTSPSEYRRELKR